MDVVYSINLIIRWTSAIQCVYNTEEKYVPLLVTPLVAAIIATAVGTVGGFFYSI